MDNPPLFNKEGKLNPSITILGTLFIIYYLSVYSFTYQFFFLLLLKGCFVQVPSEKILLNSIVLPHKELARSFKNEIIL